MTNCVVKNCKNTSANLKNNSGLSFHWFPREPNLRSEWIKALSKSIGDDCWVPSACCVVCSLHFDESDMYLTKTGIRRLRQNSIPTKNLLSPAEISIVSASSHNCHGSPCITSISTNNYTRPMHSKSTPTTTVPGTAADYLSLNLIVKDSVVDCTSDTPLEVKLKIALKKHQILRKGTEKKIKCLLQKIRRLKRKNISLKSTLKDLGLKNLTDMDKKIKNKSSKCGNKATVLPKITTKPRSQDNSEEETSSYESDDGEDDVQTDDQNQEQAGPEMETLVVKVEMPDDEHDMEQDDPDSEMISVHIEPVDDNIHNPEKIFPLNDAGDIKIKNEIKKEPEEYTFHESDKQGETSTTEYVTTFFRPNVNVLTESGVPERDPIMIEIKKERNS